MIQGLKRDRERDGRLIPERREFHSFFLCQDLENWSHQMMRILEFGMRRCLESEHWKKWLSVAVNVVFLLLGQGVASLLGKFYYEQGGNSIWMATLVQSAAFPILYIPFLIFGTSREVPTTTTDTISQPSVTTLCLIYIFLGVLIAGDNVMFSVGQLYLSASTYFLLSATQLGFNAVFSFFINFEKITILILNSVILLTLSATLLAVGEDASKPVGVTKEKYAIGFTCTIGASAGYALVLSLMQLAFEKVIKKETFSVVLDMQIYTSIASTFVCIIGLFASGEWKDLKGEMEGFKTGKVSYVMTLFWIAIAWQMSSVGMVGLVLTVSSLFSNFISMLSLPLAPIAATVIYHEKMNGVKIVSILMATWGFVSHLYQQYLDDVNNKSNETIESDSIFQTSDECT
ncbi:hypothetical protein Sjap_006786 [Stephania japonica]|uniref:Probable purine permease n=1 Tax=Stephania japonica TaxID=461633 RepID=A0AAP0K860_9MAGN